MADDIRSSIASYDEGEVELPDPLQEFILDDVEVSGEELGVGSYSSVLELTYKGMKCAGKKLHRSLYDNATAIGPEILDRFGTECDLLSQLRHPHIVQFLGLHLEDGSDVPILVLEFMPFALSDCIEQYRKLPEEISYSILHSVALGLNFLHTRNPPIIHRDLTANNVLLTTSMTAKISDLGMAKILNLSPAQVTRRMTVCPGTISYMPPEALTSRPKYDTKLDCFSYGVLMIHIFCGEWPIASEYLQPDPNRAGHLYPLTEVERREKYLARLSEDHPLIPLIHRCLENIPVERPNTADILEEVGVVASEHPASFANQVEMLCRIRLDEEGKSGMSSELEKLRKNLHEKENQIGSMRSMYSMEVEGLKEQLAREEQKCILQESQIAELQSENLRQHQLVVAQQEELEMLRKRVSSLSGELQITNSKLEEKAKYSVQKLKHLQSEMMAKSEERESILQRLTRGEVKSALKHSFSGPGSEALSNEYEEFFLNNADDITDLLRTSRSSSHFQAQQMSCDMVQHCYLLCKHKVLEKLSQQLESLFAVTHPPERTQEILEDTSIAYGHLVRASQLQCSHHFSEALCEEAFPRFLEKYSIRLSSRSSEASLRRHMLQACKLAWDLVTAWPPVIATRPKEFREEWQDREFQYWDKSAAKSKLLYTRPVLFHSYEGYVGVKGWVGNKEGGCGSTRQTTPTEQTARKHKQK